jgi:hypothetical protein
MKDSFMSGARSSMCLLRTTAVNTFSIPTENPALLAGFSWKLRRLIWKITEQEVSKEMSSI